MQRHEVALRASERDGFSTELTFAEGQPVHLTVAEHRSLTERLAAMLGLAVFPKYPVDLDALVLCDECGRLRRRATMISVGMHKNDAFGDEVVTASFVCGDPADAGRCWNRFP